MGVFFIYVWGGRENLNSAAESYIPPLFAEPKLVIFFVWDAPDGFVFHFGARRPRWFVVDPLLEVRLYYQKAWYI